MDWYKFHSQIEDIRMSSLDKEAGMKEDFFSSVVFAVALFLGGFNSAEAAEKAKVPQKAVEMASKNPVVRNKAAVALDIEAMKKMSNEEKKKYLAGLIGPSQSSRPNQSSKPTEQKSKATTVNANVTSIINHVLEHENLLPGQTPFRITSPKMRAWDKIYGYKVKHPDESIPESRRNFIFLENPGDVSKAVKALFYKYKTKPGKYGLPANPTLKQALEKFDQSGAAGKIVFLKKAIPGLDVNKPLSDFFT